MIRDPDRIDDVLRLLGEVWRERPDLRLGQLIVGAIQPSSAVPEVFRAEDNKIVNGLQRLSNLKPIRAYASVRFMGPSLDPLDVTMALRLPYDHVHRDGEPRLGRRRTDGTVHEYSPFRGGMWNMSTRRWLDSPLLDVHICWLLDQLEERRQAVESLLRGDVRADIFCFSSSSSDEPPRLPTSTSDRVSALGLKIEIDHYVDRDDDDA